MIRRGHPVGLPSAVGGDSVVSATFTLVMTFTKPDWRVAVRKGLIPEAEVDAALTKLYTARMRLGMFDPPSQVRWAGIPYSVNQSPEHDALSRKVAQESIVLLKNDGVLPLSAEHTVAVLGPAADDVRLLQGDYSYPAHTEIVQGPTGFAGGPYYPESVTPLAGAGQVSYAATRSGRAGSRMSIMTQPSEYHATWQ